MHLGNTMTTKPPPKLLKKAPKVLTLGTKKLTKKPILTKPVANVPSDDDKGFGDDDGWADEW